MSITHARKKSKPIDQWLALAGIAVGIILFLVPKTPAIVVVCCATIFVLLVHPLWNFWWIEESAIRRYVAIGVLTIGLGSLAFWTWPTDELASQLCLHPATFSIEEHSDYSVEISIRKGWFGKPLSAIVVHSRRMLQLAHVENPATASVASEGWGYGSASLELVNPVPVSEWKIAVPANPLVICVDRER